MEILESRNIELVGHSDLNGSGDGMQIMLKGDTLYVGHMGYNGLGTSILDVSDPANPQVVKQIPIAINTHSHKVQLAGDILLVNHEQQLRGEAPYSAGLAVYDVSEPTEPVQIGFLPIDGQGVHRIWWTGDQYAFFSVREKGYLERFLMTVDMTDPANPRIVSRWWYPGQWQAGGEEPDWEPPRRMRAHHVIVRGDRAYGGYGDGGMMIFSIDKGKLNLLSQRSWYDEVGGNTHTHTVLPLLKHNVVAVTDEPLKEYCEEPKKVVRVFDISNEREPVQIGTFPEPEGDFCERGGRFGPHNFHENRPGSYISEDILFLTYFNAGLRMYDISDPANVKEIGAFVPAAPEGQKAIQINDVYVSEDGLIFATDRLSAGIFILRPTISLP